MRSRRDMQVIRVAILLAALGAFAVRGDVRVADTFANPLDVLVADPFVLRQGDTYYLYGTSRVHEGLQVWTSDDLVRWHNRGFAFRKSGDTWSRGMFWAPEVFEIDGTFYMHFSARGGGGSHRIVLAQSDSPLGPFTEVRAPWFESDRAVIDSHVFTDAYGSRYLYYVIDCSENHHSEIRVVRLDDDLRVTGESQFCAKPSQQWEGTVWNEAPFVLKRGESYYLMYSANGATDAWYAVGYATADSPLGPWTKFEGNPILRRTDTAHGPGHHSIVESPDGSELFIVYHTHQHEGPTWERQLAIDRFRFIDDPDGGPARLHVDGPTTSPQPMPAGAARLPRGEDDEFDSDQLDRRRWTIFNEDPRLLSLRGGRLILRTADGDIWQRRADLKNLLLQPAPYGDFTVTTSLRFAARRDFEQAFICLWQDHNNFVRFSTVHSLEPKLEVVVEISGQPTVHSIPNPLGPRLYLRIARTNGRATFLASGDGESWITVAENLEIPLHAMQVGLGAAAPGSGARRIAEFDFVRFEIGR